MKNNESLDLDFHGNSIEFLYISPKASSEREIIHKLTVGNIPLSDELQIISLAKNEEIQEDNIIF